MIRYLLVFFFIFISEIIYSQSNMLPVQHDVHQIEQLSDSLCVIISPGTDNISTIANLETTLKTFNGVRSYSYCSNHNIFVLVIEKNVYATKQLCYAQIKTNTGITTLLLKEGSSNEILPFCNESRVPETISKH